MNNNSKIKKNSAATGLALATLLLASPVAAHADQSAPGEVKAYPLKKCVVDGQKLSKATQPYSVVRDGQKVILCRQQCLPKFDQHSTKYLKKVQRAEARAAAIDQPVGLPLALDSSPGGLAWPGY